MAPKWSSDYCGALGFRLSSQKSGTHSRTLFGALLLEKIGLSGSDGSSIEVRYLIRASALGRDAGSLRVGDMAPSREHLFREASVIRCDMSMTGDEEGLSRISWSQGTASASLQVWGCSYEGFRCASALRPFGQDLDCDFGRIPWSDRASGVFRDLTRKSRFAAAISSEISSRRLWGPSGLCEVAWNFRVPLRRTVLLGSSGFRTHLHDRIGTSSWSSLLHALGFRPEVS